MSNVNMEVDIPNDTVEILLRQYLTDTLSEPSSELYDDQIAIGKTPFEAAGNAVFNECMMDILKRKLKELNIEDN